jgi:LmbE family N-acetylglucosaminyl deacetylase
MKILIICAHTDDEIGCAGSIVRMIEEGHEVIYRALCGIEKALVQAGKSQDTARIECIESMKRLGIKNSYVYSFENRVFPKYRQEILDVMLLWKNKYKPDIVFIPASTDIHQDHQVVHNEGVRAFKHSTIMGYELPQNIISAKNSSFIKLKSHQIQLKVYAIQAYISQTERIFMSPEFIWGQARMRGVQCNSEYAEAFELIRMVI